jgi:hypothetical protein
VRPVRDEPKEQRSGDRGRAPQSDSVQFLDCGNDESKSGERTNNPGRGSRLEKPVVG